jgi:hypothetical protein
LLAIHPSIACCCWIEKGTVPSILDLKALVDVLLLSSPLVSASGEVKLLFKPLETPPLLCLAFALLYLPFLLVSFSFSVFSSIPLLLDGHVVWVPIVFFFIGQLGHTRPLTYTDFIVFLSLCLPTSLSYLIPAVSTHIIISY